MIFKSILTVLILLSANTALAEIHVVTTLPDIAWAVKEIGGDKVEVKSLLHGYEDPHFADAKPDFILKVAHAQVVCSVGLELEIGWLPKVLTKSGNAAVEAGGNGFCELGKNVQVLEKPSGAVDRSMGDVHAFGNPHFWLSPIALADGSRSILETLSTVDPSNAAFYEKNYAAFRAKLENIVKLNKAKLAKAKSLNAIQYHKEFTYFFDVYGIHSFGAIEEVPGVPPSAARLAKVSLDAKRNKVNFALAAEHSPLDLLAKFHEISGIPVISLPTSIQPDGAVKDYESLQNKIIQEILKAVP